MDIHTSPVGWKVIGCAIRVHRELGPGLLESAYEPAVAREFTLCGVRFKRQEPLTRAYKGEELGRVYRVDYFLDSLHFLAVITICSERIASRSVL